MPHILLIEDDDADAFMIEKALRDHMQGSSCTRVGTVAAAVAFIRRRGADVILLDLHLPDATTAAESCARVTQCAGRTPLIISTHLQDHTLARANSFLDKQLIALRPEHVRTAIAYAMARDGEA